MRYLRNISRLKQSNFLQLVKENQSMSLPKVLIIGQPFNNDTGGGITLSNLFSGWDKDKIAVVCSPYLLQDNIDTNICDTYYQLGQKEGRRIFPFNLFNRKYYSGVIKFTNEKKSTAVLKKSPF